MNIADELRYMKIRLGFGRTRGWSHANLFLNKAYIWQHRVSRAGENAPKWSGYISRVLYTQSGIFTGKALRPVHWVCKENNVVTPISFPRQRNWTCIKMTTRRGISPKIRTNAWQATVELVMFSLHLTVSLTALLYHHILTLFWCSCKCMILSSSGVFQYFSSFFQECLCQAVNYPSLTKLWRRSLHSQLFIVRNRFCKEDVGM